jgi:hypothetical protein
MKKIPQDAVIAAARKRYHSNLLRAVLTVNQDGIPSNADKASKLSIQFAQGIAERLQSRVGEKLVGQTSGSEFELINKSFIEETFLHLGHLRPGSWEILKIGNKGGMAIANYEQYAHLKDVAKAAKENHALAAALGYDYNISPDIIIIRELLEDAEINDGRIILDQSVCRKADIRKKNGGKALLHASISSKWTIRSDRSQNSRSEALNLIRNRKGRLPHIVVIAGEPLPARLASIALGTGDIDCVYHFALHELIETVKASGAEDSIEMLDIMIDGKRLKDISDLPLDLIV